MKGVRTAAIFSIGDELLRGRTPNNNFTWLARYLYSLGVRVVYSEILPDDEYRMLEAWKRIRSRVTLVICTGGLGPTPDDRTKPALARLFQVPLVWSEEAWKSTVFPYIQKEGISESDALRSQAMIPDGFVPLRNGLGSAPGLWKQEMIEGKPRIWIALPGVPAEMQWIFREEVIPRLRKLWEETPVYQQVFRIAGFLEADVYGWIQEMVSGLAERVEMGSYPSDILVDLIFSAPSREDLESVRERIHSLLHHRMYAEDPSLSLPAVVLSLLKKRKETLGCAESCTGGRIAGMLTSIPGSSMVFRGSVVAYQEEMKSQILGIAPELIQDKGVVSGEVVREMTRSVLDRLSCHWAIATTGYAGPESEANIPPGVVWIGIGRRKAFVHAFPFFFQGNREQVLNRTVIVALELLRRMLLEHPVEDLVNRWKWTQASVQWESLEFPSGMQ